MSQETVRLSIPFEALVTALADLSLKDKLRLWELLEEQLAQAEEEIWEQDATLRAEIQAARTAYETGDYVTLDEYIAQRQGRAE